jgi:ABC-2 type transport system permease protein
MRLSLPGAREGALAEQPSGVQPWLLCLRGICWREFLRFLMQRGRFFAALVRPLVWLMIFAAGFRSILGVSIQPPYVTYILYEVYIMPGLCGMILLFSGMQGSLSMVYDQEMGSMRVLLVSPLPRWYLLGCKLVAIVLVACLQVYVFLGIGWLFDIRAPAIGYLTVFPALMLAGLMLGALGLLLSSFIRQLENFAGVMNFIIFPMFFASSALYPLWRMQESSLLLYQVSAANPFTHAVELIRFALYAQVEPTALAYTCLWAAGFLIVALYGYNPARGFMARTGKGG